MITFFSQLINRIDRHPLGWLWVASMFCVTMACLQVVITLRPRAMFLVWNLFLAWLPVLFALQFVRIHPKKRTWAWVFAGLWLLFFPNSAYIITDFKHLRGPESPLLFYNICMVAGFAFTGLMLSFRSLFYIHRFLAKRLSQIQTWFLVMGIVLLSSFGIYLGRDLRLNSWDVFSNPVRVVNALVDVLTIDKLFWRALGFTAVFFVFQLVFYRIFYRFLNLAEKD